MIQRETARYYHSLLTIAEEVPDSNLSVEETGPLFARYREATAVIALSCKQTVTTEHQ